MSSTLTLGQNAAASPSTNSVQDPLPADPQGQQLCKIFGSYLYCSIYADAPQSTTEKPKWHTQRRYKLKSRVLYRDWQDAQKLIGVRPGHAIAYALLDIDINSPYHPRQDESAIARIEAALETIGITRTIRIRSSWSEGIHLYLPLPESVKTFDLAVALKNCLEPQGFRLKPGHLECFPNVKAYGNLIKTEYLAHRLPLQPASGACLLDEAFNPASNRLEDFLNDWEMAAARQDISTLRQALPLARQNRFKKVRRRLNKVNSWKQDLETVIAEGWTGPGQTNQLLKEIGCYGHVFLGHGKEALVNFIYHQAVSSPGYAKWCRHQREIKMRSRVWAISIEKYYWPLGTHSKASQKPESKAVISFNNLRARSAQENISAAVQRLESGGGLPEKATARAQAIRKAQADTGASSSSLETLYKAEHKVLWHPDFYCSELPVIDESMGVADVKNTTTCLREEELKSSENSILRTEQEIMKCVAIDEAISSAKTKFYSGKGGGGGIKSFPQDEATLGRSLKLSKNSGRAPILTAARKTESWIPALPILDSQIRTGTSSTKGISKAVSETITAIQTVVQKLGWSIDEICEFVAEKFQGKRRAQLSDEELVSLLYHLRVQYLEKGQVALSSA